MEEEIITIRTLGCDICNRCDSITLSRAELKATCEQNVDDQIGAYPVEHFGHSRIVYFDIYGSYLGDTITMHD
ncbi:MAG: hypothetical protein INQ03_09260 [Candidatus Heimdallarchaeota archaeon]|nr:hypothetical protein [Candidatus Heimdallarchaeota archaeon]